MDYNKLLYLLFWYSSCPRFRQWNSLELGSCVLLMCHHHSFSISLLSGTMAQAYLVPCCSSSGLSHCSMEPGSFHGGWYLEAKICLLGVLIDIRVLLHPALSALSRPLSFNKMTNLSKCGK